ncbi:MAG: T9SS type A sorting domain-containing protein [Bacteroidales bacterium]|nr:T9SS type A sorting domain-containing protein [Bacteroidales bacterium]
MGYNGCGDGGSSSIEVTVNEIPTTPIISLAGTILSSNAPTGNQWYNQIGLITGAVEQNYQVTEIGDYYTIVTLNGCPSEASNTITITTLALNDILNSGISVYPNPFADVLTVEIDENKGIVTFEIINSVGVIVEQGNFSDSKMINTSKLNSGIYFLKITNNKSVEYIKIIKE